jgi:hypothetical protein
MLYSPILSYGRIKVQLNFDWYQLEVCGFNSSIPVEFYGEDLNIKHRVGGIGICIIICGVTWTRSGGAGTPASAGNRPISLA